MSGERLDFSITAEQLAALRAGAVAVPEAAAIFRVDGAGAFTCLQGLFTCDLAPLGDAGLAWGAVLTPKGMILFDAFVSRAGETCTLVLDPQARATAAELFRRMIPPRLARVHDLTEESRVVWQLGTGTPPIRPSVVTAAAGTREARGTAADLAAARILAGWPTLGREIDEKTLPQEVRFDELGGVSYTKGCYTGQETVARVHFRGHVNRALRGVELAGTGPIGDRAVKLGEKEVGLLRSTLTVGGGMIGLATVRREVEDGALLQVGGREARLVTLPFGPDCLS